jgi:hypothetical protein
VFHNKQTDCVFINFDVLLERALIKAIDNLLELGLFDIEDIRINLNNTNVKNVFRHFVMFEVCESIIKCPFDGYRVIYHFLPLNLSRKYVTKVADVDMDQLESLIMRILHDMGKYLPIVLYKGNLGFSEFQTLLDTSGGEQVECINDITKTMKRFDPTSFNFSDIRRYTRKYRLNFLSNDYFDQLRTKKLFYRC